eukprot:491931_1
MHRRTTAANCSDTSHELLACKSSFQNKHHHKTQNGQNDSLTVKTRFTCMFNQWWMMYKKERGFQKRINKILTYQTQEKREKYTKTQKWIWGSTTSRCKANSDFYLESWKSFVDEVKKKTDMNGILLDEDNLDSEQKDNEEDSDMEESESDSDMDESDIGSEQKESDSNKTHQPSSSTHTSRFVPPSPSPSTNSPFPSSFIHDSTNTIQITHCDEAQVHIK